MGAVRVSRIKNLCLRRGAIVATYPVLVLAVAVIPTIYLLIALFIEPQVRFFKTAMEQWHDRRNP